MSEEPRLPQCYGEVCITCSDTAVQVTVRRLLDDAMALVDTGAGEETVSIALVTAKVGDTVLVHAREAIAVIGGLASALLLSLVVTPTVYALFRSAAAQPPLSKAVALPPHS